MSLYVSFLVCLCPLLSSFDQKIHTGYHFMHLLVSLVNLGVRFLGDGQDSVKLWWSPVLLLSSSLAQSLVGVFLGLVCISMPAAERLPIVTGGPSPFSFPNQVILV